MEGQFAKTMLKVGTYHSPDGVVEVTPERLRHWERQAKAIQSVGYAIPSHFDHADDEELLTPVAEQELQRKVSRSARNTVAKLKSFTVSPDGQSAQIVLHTLDPIATQRVATNSVYVSPVIHPRWKDGTGRVYEDALTSFDLVDWPWITARAALPHWYGWGKEFARQSATSKHSQPFWSRPCPQRIAAMQPLKRESLA